MYKAEHDIVRYPTETEEAKANIFCAIILLVIIIVIMMFFTDTRSVFHTKTKQCIPYYKGR